MKACELYESISRGSHVGEGTCDVLKIGRPDKEVRKVAVVMFGTVDVIRQAKVWGADMMIVHEPLFFEHMECGFEQDAVKEAKVQLLKEADFPVYRFHDHAHAMTPDLITTGQLESVGAKGKLEKTEFFASYRFEPDRPITARELAYRFEKMTGVKHVRMVGDLDYPVRHMAACFGTPGGIWELLTDPTIELMCIGEICEWAQAEYVRDAATLGHHKALLVLGHIGSERMGMKLLATRMQTQFSDIETRYFECGEVYSYH